MNLTLGGSDPDGDTLTFTVVTPPAHGTLTGTAPSLTYQPAVNYVGADSFSYRVSDGRLSVTATNTITVNPIKLAITVASTNVLISWPQTSATDMLEQTGALTLPTNTWSAAGGVPVASAGRWQVTLPATGTNAYFRLRSP